VIDVSALKPGEEMDRLVAEKVFGLQIADESAAPLRFVRMGNTVHPHHVLRYSTDCAAASEVLAVEVNDPDGFCRWYWELKETPLDWEVTLYYRAIEKERSRWIKCNRKTLPEAICAAALRRAMDP
jgi:hypothetical protein